MTPALFALALLAALRPAHAQAEDAAPPPQVIIQDRTEIDEHEFRELQVEGRIVGPTMTLSSERSVRAGHSWIALRSDFSREMSASVAEID